MLSIQGAHSQKSFYHQDFIFMIIPLILILLFLNNNLVFAQDGRLSGRISDLKNNPLTGVNIILMNTTYGASTDSSGEFVIDNIKTGNYIIIISSLGFERIELRNQNITPNTPFISIRLKETAVQSEQVVVTAGKYEQTIRELPVSASLITSADIAKKNFLTVDQALRYAPGVSMTQDQISIRGSSGFSRGVGTRVLVAFDGIPISTGDTGEIIWEMIPVTEIDRVEIIKGAASSLYGSTAIGGVVNIIPKRLAGSSVTYFKGLFGSYDRPSHKEWDWSNSYRTFNSATLTHSDRFKKLGFTLSFSRYENLGYRENDFSKRYIGYIRTNYDLSESSSLSFFANYINQNRGNFVYWKDSKHALEPPDADVGQRVKSNRYIIGANYRYLFTNNFFINLKTNFNYAKWIDQTSSNDTSSTDLIRTELQTNYNPTKSLFLIGGIETINSEVSSNIFDNPKAFNLGIYTQADYKFEFPLIISAGFRYDYSKLDTTNQKNAFSPKFGLNYKISDKTSIRTSIGRGFRAPSLAEAFTNTFVSGIRIHPNPQLQSETNLTVEAGINHSFNKDFIFDAALFQNEYYNFIEPNLNSKNLTITFNNITRARIQGLEFNSSLGIIPDILNLSFNYVYLWARDINLNKALKYRPKNSIYIKTDYSLGNLEFGVDFRYWSRVEEIDNELVDYNIIHDGNKRVPVYVLDLRTGYNLLSLGFPGKIYLNINNLLNYNYVEIIGNLSPIRNISLSTEILF